ncbi:OmpA family protein [Pontivivens nitratireducens]|uniref:OmpA family protein n=1 Tax=Pontivivens nitratireducens TaxID=2758038 RepID=A0A6G7VPT1_9RHOB|nr:OmpA family protein [Pontibrevibacter nitratireducens]QIK41930.1 OmpA family protein [Pontibrevibacter nitratireducens]
MKLFAILFAALSLGASGAGAFYLAQIGADEIEAQTGGAVRNALSAAGQDWVTVEVDGMTVTLSGTSPSEAAKFRALDVAEAVVPQDRIASTITLTDAEVAVPEVLNLDILLAPDLVTLLGNTPQVFNDQIAELLGMFSRRVVDLTRPVETEPQADWEQTLTLLGSIAPQITTGRVMVTDGGIAIEAALADAELRQSLVAEIEAATPQGQQIDLSLSAPRMTLSPYPFDLSVSDGTFQLSTCAASTQSAARTIARQIAAATGLNDLECEVALGAPDDNWPQTVQIATELLTDLPDAALSIRDRVVQLSLESSAIDDRVDGLVARADARLPEGYSLLMNRVQAEEEPSPLVAAAPRGLTMTIAPGRISAVGAVTGEAGVETMQSYAETAFPGRSLTLDLIASDPGAAPSLADALALLDVMNTLDTGTIRIGEATIHITGTGEGPGLATRIEGALTSRLTGTRDLEIDIEEYEPVEVTEVEALPEVLKSPAECSAEITAAQQEDRILFAPSSASLDASSAGPLDEIARILATCPTVQVSIEGYTDSSGGEDMNRRISQLRADAVLDALLSRGVFLDRMSATGYGEASPIADNDTAEGREANRRIEFELSTSEPDVDPAADAPTQEEEDE